MPDELVFKRILPASGLMMCLSTFYYASLAYRLAKKTGRTDVCALPSGISVPHMFIVTLVIMLPVKLATGDPMKGWQAGLTWVFIPELRSDGGRLHRPHHPPDHAQGRLAGCSGRRLHHLHLDEAGAGDVPDADGRDRLLRDHLVSWFGGVKFGGIPAGLVAIAAGTLIAWGSNCLACTSAG